MKPLLRTFLLIAIVCSSSALFAQRSTISGYVTDNSSGESLIGANVYIKELLKGTSSNQYGFYSITLDHGTYTLVVSFLGYEDHEYSFELKEDIQYNVEIRNSGFTTKEVEIIGKKKDDNTESTEMGRIEMDVETIKTLPALFGEVDILKTIQLLPGVQSAGEGNSGFYVRGGGPDQNLILLDEATVYNPTHLFGFFSVFNADAIKNIELIKGGMPANYGGRLSSVLNIHMNDGNNQEFHADGGIGLISSRLTLQGPIVKKKASYIVSGRRTYVDILTKPFVKKGDTGYGSGYFFYDVNAKVNYTLSDKDRLYLSGYFGKDVFDFNGGGENTLNFKIPWGNTIVAARWNHLFSSKLFMNLTATFSDYKFEFQGEQDQFSFSLFSGIKDYGLKLDLSHYPNIRHSLKYGGQYTYHTYTPSTVSARSGDTEFDTGDAQKLFGHEGAVYILDEFDLTDQLRINAGLRGSFFTQVGPFDRYVLNDEGLPTDVIEYGSKDKVANYQGLEPRLSIRYRLNEKSSVKAAFTQNYQYIHLTSFSSTGLPTDVWMPSTDKIKPQFATQYNIGYFRNFMDNLFETSVEVYYKDMDNLVEYKEGSQPQDNVNNNVDNQLTFGTGYSYGIELFIKKKFGRLTGWVGYTWSRTMRTFEELNFGNEYPARYDRRHDLSIVGTYKLNDRWTFGAIFVYATGQSISLPVNRYWIEGQLVSEYTEKNGYRMVPYHRLDLSAVYEKQKFKTVKDPDTGEEVQVKKKFQSSWAFGIYNVYNRANPYFIYFDSTGGVSNNSLQIQAKQVSLFSIIPSVTWNFKF